MFNRFSIIMAIVGFTALLALSACGSAELSARDNSTPPATISGTIVESGSISAKATADSTQLQAAEVSWATRVIDANGDIVAETVTDARGNFNVDVPDRAHYHLTAVRGSVTVEASVDATVASTTRNVIVTVGEAGDVEVTITITVVHPSRADRRDESNDGDSDDPTDPTDPTEPTDPIEPTDPDTVLIPPPPA